MEDIKLSGEQEALFKVMEGTNQHLFITGRAGAGKSVLLRHFRENTHKKVVVTAPTGIAALNVRGQTIHSLFKLPPQLFRKGSLSPNKRLESLLKRIDCVVIDEISMVRADLLDAIDERLRQSHQSDQPFGGVQIIMFGDVYQLPPVVEENLAPYFEAIHGGHFFFNALAWKETEFKVFELTQVFRQKDPVFKDILNAVRDGTVVDSQLEQLNVRHGITPPEERVITLAPTNNLVTQINQRKLDELPGQSKKYKAEITGEMKRSVFPTEEILELKKGSQIVLLKNDQDKRWVNGTVGKVEELHDDYIKIKINEAVYDLEKVTWEEIAYTYDAATHKVEAKTTSSFTQYPIRLAWALTIHKSQGQTYEQVCLDLTSRTFAAGQMYVALSRCTSLEGLYLKMPVKKKDIIVEPKVSMFMARRETIKVEIEEGVTEEYEETITVIHHDEIIDLTNAEVEDVKNNHDEIETRGILEELAKEVQTDIHHDVIEEYKSLTNAKREKTGRTKKERKSPKGRKAKSGVVREPLQLSLDVRTIKALNRMGVNKSQLFEDFLQQYGPFLEALASIDELSHDEN